MPVTDLLNDLATGTGWKPTLAVAFLVVGLLGLAAAAVVRAQRHEALSRREVYSFFGVLGALAAWAAVAYGLSWAGAFRTAAFYRTLPGFWLPVVPMGVVCLPLVFRSYRSALARLYDATPLVWLTLVQAVRLGGVGTLVRTAYGAFPPHFEWAIGVPDLAFGASALAMARLQHAGRIGPRALAVWHTVGATVIVVSGGVLIQVGLPGPMQLLATPPTTAVLFEPYMVLAPAFTVPAAVLLNAFALAGLLRGLRSRDPA